MTSSTLPEIGSPEALRKYEALMEVIRNRMTNRAFVADYRVPDDHFERILEAARHAPSGANSQPWHFVVVRDPEVRATIGDLFVEEQRSRAALKMKFPTPNYSYMSTAPGFIVVATDYRLVRAFPVLADDRGPAAEMYRRNAERILLQSVAAATMSAHLAAAALGYAVWWITAIGQDEIARRIRPMIGLSEELTPVDIICFGPPRQPSYKRWKKELPEIMSWDTFDPANLWSQEELDAWIKTRRHRVMYRDAANVD